MPDKFISIVGSGQTEIAGLVTSAGVGSAGRIPALDANGLLDPSVMPSGLTPDQKSGTSNGTITAKDMCYVETAGTITRASAASGTPHEAIGYALTSVATGQPITIQLEGKISGLTGLTPGAQYFLSNTTPGGVTATPPSATGELWQPIGNALSATEMNFEPDKGVLRA